MSIFQDLPTMRWTKSIKSRRTPKWLRSWARATLRVAMLPTEATRTQYLRHFDASNVQLMGPDPSIFGVRGAGQLADITLFDIELESGARIRVSRPKLSRRDQDDFIWDDKVSMHWRADSPVVLLG